ncbi:DUF2845 domain-containing protein [Marinobacteraceae bacterium S3BR75-40.1]
MSRAGKARVTTPACWLLLGLGVLFASPALAFRCDGGLVDIGDWAIEVREKCGEPDYVARFPSEVVPGIGLVQTVEHWYYDRGSTRFIRRLIFRDEVLRGIDTHGYGFPSNAASRCDPGDLLRGMTEYELYRRCGKPLSRRTWWSKSLPYGSAAYLLRIFPVEEWLYDFGGNRFRRVVRLESGVIVDLERRDKPR